MKLTEIVRSRQFGQWRYARLHRSGGAPTWSWNNWLCTGDQSGGAVLDMHIHDVDAALWWFGQPDAITASGIAVDGLPLTVDTIWTYKGGRMVSLHGGWDLNGGPFRYAFKVMFENATVSFDSSLDPNNLIVQTTNGSEKLSVDNYLAYQAEIDDIVDCLRSGRRIERITTAESKLAVAVVREEMAQIEAGRR
jgi:predicted dehydrogenase